MPRAGTALQPAATVVRDATPAHRPSATAGEVVPAVVTVTIASPTPDPEAATAKLQLRLRERLIGDGHPVPADGHDLAGLVVTGPRESTDPHGRAWFWFRGTVQVSDALGVRNGTHEDSRSAAARTGARASRGGADQPCIGPEGEWTGENSVVLPAHAAPEASEWALRPVPPRLGSGWECHLPSAAAAARVRRDLRTRLLKASLAGHCTVDAGEDLLLAFEELTSNAFRHGAGAVDVTIAATAAGWLLVVGDEAPDRPPVPAVAPDRALGGMGLEMVAGLSREFGWQPARGRKSVWAELPSHR